MHLWVYPHAAPKTSHMHKIHILNKEAGAGEKSRKACTQEGHWSQAWGEERDIHDCRHLSEATCETWWETAWKVGDRVQVASDRQGHLCGRQGEILKVAADLVVKMDKGLKAVVMPIADVVKVDKHALAPTSLTPGF